MECNLVEVVESGLNEIFIGEIMGTYTEEIFLTDGKLDFRKMKPLILSQPDTSYWSLLSTLPFTLYIYLKNP